MKFCLVAIFFLASCVSHTYTMTEKSHQIYQDIDNVAVSGKIDLMAGTPYQTPAFIYDSGKPGSTALVIGGTHGNEPAGYEAALRLVDLLQNQVPQQGKVIVIPLANRKAVEDYNRYIPVPGGVDRELGNLNRCYPGDPQGLPMQQMAHQIQQLAIEHKADIFIDMHEAPYLHLDTPPESYRDMGLGQTMIYSPNEPSGWLLIELLDNINEGIAASTHKFSSIDKPILHSAAWWAGEQLGIAAFTFETYKKVDIEERIAYHLGLVEIALKFAEIWPVE
jgi:succinylglutamate desuccinylase